MLARGVKQLLRPAAAAAVRAQVRPPCMHGSNGVEWIGWRDVGSVWFLGAGRPTGTKQHLAGKSTLPLIEDGAVADKGRPKATPRPQPPNNPHTPIHTPVTRCSACRSDRLTRRFLPASPTNRRPRRWWPPRRPCRRCRSPPTCLGPTRTSPRSVSCGVFSSEWDDRCGAVGVVCGVIRTGFLAQHGSSGFELDNETPYRDPITFIMHTHVSSTPFKNTVHLRGWHGADGVGEVVLLQDRLQDPRGLKRFRGGAAVRMDPGWLRSDRSSLFPPLPFYKSRICNSLNIIHQLRRLQHWRAGRDGRVREGDWCHLGARLRLQGALLASRWGVVVKLWAPHIIIINYAPPTDRAAGALLQDDQGRGDMHARVQHCGGQDLGLHRHLHAQDARQGP